MTLTLLLDLDDTLLTNDIDTFVPAYLKALGKHLYSLVPPDKMVHNLLAATQVMINKNTPALTLEYAFDEAFYPAIGRTKEEMRAALTQFYDELFPGLSNLTAERPEAIHLVNRAIEQGHSVVVATNPIFPREAILHRLRWAGLAPERTPFSLITDFERFHFAKPNPAFFAEILAQLGWPDQPAVVVGNSLEDDLVPAAKLGLPVYWVVNNGSALPANLPPLSACGPLSDVAAWVDHINAANPRQEFTTPQAILAVLKSTPAALDTLSQGFTPRQWQERPAPGEWSLTEIICHLRDVDREINIPRLERVLGEPDPFVPGINSDSWADERDYLHQDGPQALRDFIAVRSKWISLLEALPEADWQRSARHAIFGPTRLQELISFSVTHDRTHIQQVIATAKNLP